MFLYLHIVGSGFRFLDGLYLRQVGSLPSILQPPVLIALCCLSEPTAVLQVRVQLGKVRLI
jgi:hypothetical protein